MHDDGIQPVHTLLLLFGLAFVCFPSNEVFPLRGEKWREIEVFGEREYWDKYSLEGVLPLECARKGKGVFSLWPSWTEGSPSMVSTLVNAKI